MRTVKFRSNTSNYWKEKYGIKPNTFRKIDDEDDRFIFLLNGEIKFIEIRNADVSGESFTRIVKDITFWDGHVIISWEHSHESKKEKKDA